MKNDYLNALKQLNPNQRKAVELTEGPVMVLAGPGTGKTQILASRIGYILENTDTEPNNILCLTYTDAGAIAMRQRLIKFMGGNAHKVQIHTFHSFCHKIIRENTEYFGMKEKEPITDLERIELMQQLIDGFNTEHPLKRYKAGTYYDIPNFTRLFSLMKTEGWNAKYIEQQSQAYLQDLPNREEFIYKKANAKKGIKTGDLKQHLIDKEADKMAKLIAAANEFNNYQNILHRNGKYDFDDMILWVLEAFKENTDLLLTYQEQFLYFLVDEYQDTNGAQNELIDLLTNFWHEPNIFVVGDDDQSIYRFQGANVANLKQFITRYIAPLPPAEQQKRIIVLSENYRSSQHILNASKALINQNQQRLENEFEWVVKALAASNTEVANLQNQPEIWEYQSQTHEVVGIANYIKNQVASKQAQYNDFAILYLKHAQAEPIARYFQTQNIPINIKRRVNVLEEPLTQKLINLLYYFENETKQSFSGEEPLFKLLHYHFFELDTFELARCAYYIRENNIRTKENKHKPPLKWREALFNFLETDNPAHQKIKQALASLEELIQLAQNEPLQRFFDHVLQKCNVISWVAKQDEKLWLIEELNTFFDFIKKENNRNKALTIGGLLESINTMQQHNISLGLNKINAAQNGVNFVTAHSSKGLEFKHVFIVGCQQNIWKPSSRSYGFSMPHNLVTKDTTADEEEQRRVFFVGITRAEQSLTLTYALQNYEEKPLLPASYLTELADQNMVKLVTPQVNIEQILAYQTTILGNTDKPSVKETELALLDLYLAKYKLSVTHMNNYLECPLKFYYSNFLRVPMAKNAAMEFGSAMHYALEKYYGDMLENNQQFPPIEKAYDYYTWFLKTRQEIFTAKEFKNYLEYGKKTLKAYFDKYLETANRNVKLEKYITTVYNGIPLSGICDKLEFTNHNINVVDYKTGKYSNSKSKYKKFNKPGEKLNKDTPDYVAEYGGDYWRQAVFYKILLENDLEYQNYNVASSEFDFIEQEKDAFETEKIDILPEHVSIVKEQILQVYENIQAKNFTGCGKPDCKWCEFEQNKQALVLELEDIED